MEEETPRENHRHAEAFSWTSLILVTPRIVLILDLEVSGNDRIHVLMAASIGDKKLHLGKG